MNKIDEIPAVEVPEKLIEAKEAAQSERDKVDNIIVEVVKKTKKSEPRIFPFLMQIDREAFEDCGQTNTRFIMKQFWQSASTKIIIAKKRDTGAVLGYAIFSVSEPIDERFGKKKRLPAVYLLRIAVKLNCQRMGIGRRLVNYLFQTYPKHGLSLDVSTDNDKAVQFYQRIGLQIHSVYMSVPDNVEFALFETPLDRRGNKILSSYERQLHGIEQTGEDVNQQPIQVYYQSLEAYRVAAAGPSEKEQSEASSLLMTPVKASERKDQKVCLSAQNTQESTTSSSSPDKSLEKIDVCTSVLDGEVNAEAITVEQVKECDTAVESLQMNGAGEQIVPTNEVAVIDILNDQNTECPIKNNEQEQLKKNDAAAPDQQSTSSSGSSQ